jgi:hypothetical protein
MIVLSSDECLCMYLEVETCGGFLNKNIRRRRVRLMVLIKIQF